MADRRPTGAYIVSAERISTTGFESFPGGAFVDIVQRLTSDNVEPPGNTRSVRWTRRQSSGMRHLRNINLAEVYGHRPNFKSSEVWWLSPYEFTVSWCVALACVPTTRREWETEDEISWDVTLTRPGLKYIQQQCDPDKSLCLKPSIHYKLKITASNERILLDEGTGTEHLQHLCYICNDGNDPSVRISRIPPSHNIQSVKLNKMPA